MCTDQLDLFSPAADPGFSKLGHQPKSGAQTYYLAKFNEKCMEMKKLGREEGSTEFIYVDPALLTVSLVKRLTLNTLLIGSLGGLLLTNTTF